MPTQTPSGVGSKAAAQLAAEVGLLEAAVTGQPRDAAFFAQIQKVQLGLFRLVVVGEIKKGKSSFVNALCGIPRLVPVHSDVATSTVFKLRHGTGQRYSVYFQPTNGTSESPPKKEISAEEVATYGTEDGNPKNEKGVDFIAVEAPSPLLHDGLIVVDTPGVGGLFKEHREITFRHAPKADAIFFVTDSVESPIGAAEVAFLKELRSVTNLIFFVQTKADKADRDACRRRMENNVAILCEQAGFKREELRYFVVSSTLKIDGDAERNLDDLNESGFPPLMRFLQEELVRQKEATLGAIALRMTRAKIETLREPLVQRKQVLDADSEEKRQQLDGELHAAEEAMREWSSGDGKRLLREISDEITAIFTRRRGEFDRALRPGGTISDKLQNDLEKLANRDAVFHGAGAILNDTRAAASRALLTAEQAIADETRTLFEKAVRKAGLRASELRKRKVSEADLNLGESAARLTAKAGETRAFDTLRTAAGGFGIGASVCSIAGVLIGSVIPVVGTIAGGWVGATIAGLWAAGEAISFRDARDRETARREVQAAVDRELGNLHLQASNALQLNFQKLRGTVEDAIQDGVEKHLGELAIRRQDVQSRRSADAAELKEKRAALNAQARQFTTLEARLSALEKTAGLQKT